MTMTPLYHRLQHLGLGDEKIDVVAVEPSLDEILVAHNINEEEIPHYDLYGMGDTAQDWFEGYPLISAYAEGNMWTLEFETDTDTDNISIQVEVKKEASTILDALEQAEKKGLFEKETNRIEKEKEVTMAEEDDYRHMVSVESRYW